MQPHRRSFLPLSLAVLLASPTLPPVPASTSPASSTLRIGGRVVHDSTGAPLQAAQILIRGTTAGALTDADGHYMIVLPRTRLPEGEVRLVAALIGFRQAETVLDARAIRATDSLTVDFRLHPQPLSLETIVVSGVATAPPQRMSGARPAGIRTAPGRPRPVAPEASLSAPDAYPIPARGRRGWNREQYDAIEENGFLSVVDHPLSTFSIDVDRASYSNVRRFLLQERRLPPVDAVQVEEMVNYFSYDYALPEGDDPVAITAELGTAPWNADHSLLRIGLASRPVPVEEMPPSNLVFLLDVSGSMSSPDKLPLVQASMRLLARRLRPADRVAIVVYAGAAGLVLPPTSGARKERILDAIERLRAGGSTAGGAGLRLAYRVARESFLRQGNNRVILATDGDFNVGESSDAAMVRLVEEERGQGTFLTVLGFGTGNLQAAKMQGLAQHGNGNWAYIDSMEEARKVLVREMGGTLLTVAKDVKVQIEFDPSRVGAYRLLGYENRLLADEDFNDDAKDAGELGAGHTVTALYEIIPATGSYRRDAPATVDPLRYQAPRQPSVRSDGSEIAFVKVRYKRPHGSESHLLTHAVRVGDRETSCDFHFAAAVAGFGMLLRGSEYRGSLSARQVLALAEDGLGPDSDGYRHGFLELVEAYRALTGSPRGRSRRPPTPEGVNPGP